MMLWNMSELTVYNFERGFKCIDKKKRNIVIDLSKLWWGKPRTLDVTGAAPREVRAHLGNAVCRVDNVNSSLDADLGVWPVETIENNLCLIESGVKRGGQVTFSRSR